jgi:hypothetical protein
MLRSGRDVEALRQEDRAVNACARCGAQIVVPPEMHVLSMRCSYCGLEQPVPNAIERQRALAQHQHQQQVQQNVMNQITDAQKSAKSMQKMIMIFVGVILLLSFGFTALMMAKGFGAFGDD